MTIKENVGNLLSVESGYIIHGCNAQRAFNSGVAKQIRLKYWEAYNSYMEEEELILGNIISVQISDTLTVINAITQKYYGNDGKRYVSYRAIRDSFERVSRLVQTQPDLPKVIHFPKIGCGLGGGDWAIVSELIDYAIPDIIEKNLWIPPSDNSSKDSGR